MSNLSVADLATRMRTECSAFITQNADNPRIGWPRLTKLDGMRDRWRSARKNCTGLRVLLIGDITLALTVKAKVLKADLLRVLHGETSGQRLSIEPVRLHVGGFVGRSAPAAAALGASVAVCTAVPDPLPTPLREFFDAFRVDTRLATTIGSLCPIEIQFDCIDGAATVRVTSPNAEPTDLRATRPTADVVLCSAGVSGTRAPICPAGLLRYLSHGERLPTIGLRADWRWNRSARRLAQGDRTWTFIRESDARVLGSVHNGSHRAPPSKRRLVDKLGVPRLVLQLGPRGAVLLNGVPRPYYARTCPIDATDPSGAGDVLMTVSTLSAALGADDRTCLRRGVAAATGYVAGLGLPSSFDELDVGDAGSDGTLPECLR